MAATRSKTQRSPTAAEAELQQRQETAADPEKGLKTQAREQRKEQQEELQAGKSGPKSGSHVIKGNPAEQRTRTPNAKPVDGIVDNMTARDGADPLVGSMVTIDYSDKKVRDSVQAQLGDHVDPGTHSADYGALLSVGEVGEDGYPVTGVVFLRDEHAARINVPWSALRRSTTGGRR